MQKGHNYGKCLKCGEVHISPRSGKKLSLKSKLAISKANAGHNHTLDWKKDHSKKMSGSGNSMFGKVHPGKGKKRGFNILVSNEIIDKIKDMITNGSRSVEIASEVKLSKYYITSLLNTQFLTKLKKNDKHYPISPSKLKGKTYEQIFGSKEKAIRRSKITSNWMKTEKNIRRFCKSPSKPQIELFNLIKPSFSEAELEFPVKINDKVTFWLDIGIPSLKLDVEYDGTYWHTLNGPLKDCQRDKVLQELGWKIIRISDRLSKEEVHASVRDLQFYTRGR